MAAPEILLTDEQRLEFTQIPENISEWEIARYYTFTEYDKEIINRHRRDYNKLGFAVQLAVLRYPGWTLNYVGDIPSIVLNHISEQINVNPDELALYAQRENTRFEHLQEIREEFGFRNYTDNEAQALLQTLITHAMENDNTIGLVRTAINELRKQKIILPGITTLEKQVSEAKAMADGRIISIINENLSKEQKFRISYLINVQSENTNTRLGWLREDPGHASPKAFAEVIARIEEIRKIGLSMNIDGLHPNRIRQLSRLGAKYEPYAFRRFDEDKRYAILAVYLYELCQNLIDKAIEIHDRQINMLMLKGRKEQEELQMKNGKSLNEKINQYADIGAALIKAKDEG